LGPLGLHTLGYFRKLETRCKGKFSYLTQFPFCEIYLILHRINHIHLFYGLGLPLNSHYALLPGHRRSDTARAGVLTAPLRAAIPGFDQPRLSA
jgi:hypothetical protein